MLPVSSRFVHGDPPTAQIQTRRQCSMWMTEQDDMDVGRAIENVLLRARTGPQHSDSMATERENTQSSFESVAILAALRSRDCISRRTLSYVANQDQGSDRQTTRGTQWQRARQTHTQTKPLPPDPTTDGRQQKTACQKHGEGGSAGRTAEAPGEQRPDGVDQRETKQVAASTERQRHSDGRQPDNDQRIWQISTSVAAQENGDGGGARRTGRPAEKAVQR